MPRITNLVLFVQTRDEEDAGTSNHLRLFSEGVEIGTFPQAVPSRGKAAKLSLNGLQLDYEDFVASDIRLGLTSDDAWAPRAAFLTGNVDGGPLRPLAWNFWFNPNSFVSQDITEGVDRWQLKNLVHAKVNDPLQHLVLVTSTRSAQGAESSGPFEFSLFSKTGRVPVLVYHTVLATVGLQAPAERAGVYFVAFSMPRALEISASQLSHAQLTLRSDDAWHGEFIHLFALDEPSGRGRRLGSWSGNDLGTWVSQDPHDSGDTVFGAFPSAEIFIEQSLP